MINGIQWNQNSCFMDVVLMVIFHPCNKQKKEILKKRTNNRYLKNIQASLVKLENNLMTCGDDDDMECTCCDLRQKLNEYVNEYRHVASCFEDFSMNEPRDAIEFLQFMQSIFEIPDQSIVQKKCVIGRKVEESETDHKKYTWVEEVFSVQRDFRVFVDCNVR